ncbi:MAG: nuclear transport factor 2 family protein [Actinomycetota bacterium]
MAHPVVERYLSATERWQQGDMSAMADAFTDDVVWHEAGSKEPLRGKQAVLERFNAMGAATSQITLHSVVADDEHLAVFGHARFTRDGESIEYDYVEEMDLRDGLVSERWSFMDAVPDDVARFFATG